MNEELVHRAEQVTLGALIVDPTAVGQVRGWLRPGDFADWWHAQTYTALLEAHTAHQPIDVPTIATVMVDRHGDRVGDRLRVLDLVATSPTPARPVAYARMVLEAGLRREVAGLGVLLRAGALQAVLADSAGPVAQTCLMVDAQVESVAARWDHAHARLHPATTLAPLHPVTVELRAGADKFLADRTTRDPAAEREHLVALVGALVAHPDQIHQVSGWLRPGQIPDPGWRAAYATLLDLTDTPTPIDPVTVAWALAPLAAHDVPVPTVDQLRQVAETGWFDHPHRAAHAVAADQVIALADRAAEQLTRVCADPAQEVATICDTAGLLTTALRHTATGLPGLTHTTTTTAPELVRLDRGPVAG